MSVKAPGKSLAQEAFLIILAAVSTALISKWVFAGLLDPNKDNKKQVLARKKALWKRLGRAVETTQYEDMIAAEVINPRDINVTLDDIGGLEDAKATLMRKVIEPLRRPHLYNGSLLKQSKGVLFYGPPGTGKTMLAKALAKESGARFINLRASTLQSKWFGDTQKLVSALFTLAYKIQPTIIFIDEVDAMLGSRKYSEHEAVTSLKTEFMQLWDGFLTDSNANVLVLAATNRPNDLDEAVLRRFAVTHEVGMPDVITREKILQVILDGYIKEKGPNVVEEAMRLNVAAAPGGKRPLQRVAELTEGCTGNDLHEICCEAAAIPVQEVVDASPCEPRPDEGDDEVERYVDAYEAHAEPRAFGEEDMLRIARSYVPAHVQAREYARHVAGRSAAIPTAPPDMGALFGLLAGLAGGLNNNGMGAGNGANNNGDHGPAMA